MTLIIVHEVTDDYPTGEPTPPPDDGGTWHAIHLGRDQTTWRRVALPVGAAEQELPAPGVGRFAKFQRAAESVRRRHAPPP